ncbi:glycosyltransferase family 2 protein [Leptolyngbya sp. FACHB-261]|uniref:glycosyltransferase family 2 protein n=1 Tax=Leptolyngbya sp. FACHB-261 TaxID=2692806 RepID=UPI0016845E58|nr:glycosyltransferase family 2 protein [Leptolyngbya sp. FACHB-261]MBD2099686.1 glycosyltransferase family 2 protein [Leptolyngbya sp. FACHB-261]
MNESNQVLVSAVIPTCGRPQIVSRAVKSALAQSLSMIEVIVVVDGPDEATARHLEQINDSRLRVVVLPVNVGAAGARNAGVSEAKGNWIAFLDDDDEWLPQKLESQLQIANHSKHTFPIVYSRFIWKTAESEFIGPRRIPAPYEHLADYLFFRKSLFYGEAFVNTSTLFAKKELLLINPLDTSLRRHEDWNWVLQVSALEGVGIHFAPEPLAITNIETGRKRLSNINDWQDSLNWIRSIRSLVTPSAYSCFLLTFVGLQAASEQNWKVFWSLLREAIELGKPRPIDFLLYLLRWLIPQEVRQWLPAIFSRQRKAELRPNSPLQ